MFKYSNKINKIHVDGDRAGPRYFKSIRVKKKQILKSLIMILAIVFSVLSSLIVDSKLTITAHATSNYGLTVKWTEGIEWVATDEAGTNRWTNGSIKYFAENTSAGTYIKLKPGYRLDCLAADSEWADWTTISDTLYYDSWSMYENRTVTVNVISEVFEENGERYTYNGNYHEAGYKLVEVDSWECTHSFEGDDIIGYIESDPSDIAERKRLNPTNEKLLASLRTYTSDSRYKIRVGSPYVKYTGEVPDTQGNKYVSKYTLYVDTHNTANNNGRHPEYGADKNNDWLLASNYRCPDTRDGADADYAGYAYYRRYYAYCKDTQSWYNVGSAHNWLGCANGDTGANEFHTQEYTHTIHKYKLVESHEYTVRLNTGNIPSSELTKLTETASTEGWTWNENGRYFSKTFVQNENNYLPGVNKFFSANNYESVGSKVTDKYFVQDKTKNPTKVLYNWWTSASGGTDIGRGKKTYNNLYEISKDNSGIVNLYPHWMGYTTVFNYTDTAPSNTAGQTVTINNNINDGMDNNLYQVYGNCFFYKGTDGEYHDYEGTNPDLKVTASIPDSNGYKYIFNGWHHKNWNYLTDGLGKLTYKNNYNIGQGKTSYSLSPHFSRVGINYNVRLNANIPNTESTLQVLHQNGISSYIYNSTSRYFSRELTYDDSQDMLSPDVYSLKGYHLISTSDWYTSPVGENTVSAPCSNPKNEYPDWSENYWNLTTTDGATVDLYARWQANNYKIAYNLDGGTYGTSHPTSADYDTMVTIDNPSKTGYTFIGWTITGYDSTTSGHNASAWTGETDTSYKNLAATDGATVTFTATWSKEAPKTARYTVKHYQMNTDGIYSSTPTNTESFSGLIGSSVTPAVKDYGQIFDKPSTKTVTISADGNTTVEYKYPRKKARVIVGKSTGIKTTDPVPGDYADGYIGQTVTLSATPETGYRFKNWTSLLKENYGTVFSTTASFNYTLTYNDSRAVQHQYGNGTSTMWGAYMQANAEPITYNIKYNYNGGIKGAFAPASAKYNEDVKISNPTKTNCIFAGWTITGYDPNTSGHSAATWTDETGASFKNLASTEGKTVTFTAIWVQKDVHLATISGRGVKLSKPLSYDGYVGETKRVTAELKPGYRFVNWTNYYNANEVISTDKDFDYKLTDKDYDNYLSDKGGTYLKSNAVPIDYTISYDLNGGTASNPVSYNVESNTFTLNNPTRAGYTFAGWCESKDTSYVYNRSANEVIKKDESDSTSYFIPECYASLDYAPVFDPAYYLAKYPDLKSVCGDDVNKALSHFVNYGMKEGRQGSAEFEVNAYKAKYKDLRDAFGDNLPKYYMHYILAGKSEGRTISQASISIYQGSIGNRTYTATWTAADVGYTVNHYVMDINGNYLSTPTKTERLSGFTDTSVTAKRLSLGNGFTYPDVQTVKVKADGTTVVNYYYSRNQYYLNLNGYLKQRTDTNGNMADLTETVGNLNGTNSTYTYATAVVKINGSVHAKGNGVTDFYEKVYYGSTYEIITTAKTGYTIIDNTGTLTGTVNGDTTVAPRLSINSYTISYEPNKPSKATENLTKMSDQKIYYNRERNLTENTYKYTGYDFIGWNTKADGTGTAYNNMQAVKNLFSTDGSTITLYAQWKIHTHKLKVYVSNENADGSFGSEWLWQDKILEYNTPYSYTGYLNDTVYQQISTSGTMYDSDITIHLKAMRKTFNQKLTVYYEQPDGSFDAGTVVINKTYRYGQTVSWNRNADVTYKAANISWSVSGTNVKELKVYRQQYKITVNGADKHVTTTGSGTYRYGYELWITAEVEAGYHFINWNMDRSLTAPSMKIEVTGDKTYTAYVEANKYLITYNLNKPARASSTPKLNTQNTLEYEYNSKILYMPTTLLTGWTFEGWYTEADGGTEIKIGDIYKWIGDITLYAHWTENTYTIHYESDGGTAINDINVKYEDPVKLSAVPYRPGYIFSYWNTKADASGHSYEGSETVRHLATGGTVTLYAVWSKKAIAQIGAAVNMTEKNGYVFGHITDDSVSIRTYVIDENGNITIK